MLDVQKYLLSGKKINDLKSELGIEAVYHKNDPLVILNYHQINSPQSHPIVKECRGLVLNTQDYSLVARSFPRFYKWGSFVDDMKKFNFDCFSALEKLDGSLCMFYYFNGSWRSNSRGSFGDMCIGETNITWNQAFRDTLKVSSLEELNLNKKYCYVCEFVSPFNRIVTEYTEPALYHLATYCGENEVSDNPDCFRIPKKYEFKNIQDVKEYLEKCEKEDPKFEGVVINDNQGYRWKIKSKTYDAYHKMNSKLFNDKHILTFLIRDKKDEILEYQPQYSDKINQMYKTLNEEYNSLLKTWEEIWDMVDQKAFSAIAGKAKFGTILFKMRRYFRELQTPSILRQEWEHSEEYIFKKLFEQGK